MKFTTLAIHLERRVDRLAHLESQCLPPYELVSGVDLTTSTPEQYFQMLLWYLRGADDTNDAQAVIRYTESVRENLRLFCNELNSLEGMMQAMYRIQLIHLEGIIGCARSHYLAWKQSAERSLPTLILEDDVIFCSELLELLQSDTFTAPQPWDVLYLNEPNRFNPNDCSSTVSKNIREVHFDDQRSFGTFSYIIHPRCATRLVNFIDERGVNAPIDWFMNYAHRDLALTFCMIEPELGLLAQHGDFSSDVQPPRRSQAN